ncbi:MAG TPA: 2-oxoacid:ferredoxin oxidoreductase subunit alpha [Nitrosopumilus sp.]|nr:2-oxoacid:ferredoxin oxidoreductase subunit alpha [Nitrosopumilus sp.]
MSSIDFTWLIGGPQGSGVESGANIFSRVCAEMGYQVFGKREFYSNIKGEHSYFTVRIADKKIHSNVNDVNLMASFDAETIFRHYDEVISGGGIIYDSDIVETKTDTVRTLDTPFKERLHQELESKNKPFTVAGVLEIAKEKGVLLFPVSFKSILQTLSEENENPRLRGLVRMYNVIGVSLSLGLVRMPPNSLQKTIDTIFSKKPEIAKINRQTATYSYNYAITKFENFDYNLLGTEKEPETLLVQGFHGTALGKMACGCRFQPYYPITPASDESVFLESYELLEIIDDRPGSTAVIQTEDEISAMGMTIGGALTGTRSATCTSGPGFALMTEMLGWAGINEVPIVITNYQRSGPSTGLPTRHGQDDLLFSIFAGHGDFPKLVYASGEIEESFYDTGNCFNYAEIFQVPVIHMMDKFHASSVITCKRWDTKKIPINRGKLLEKVEDGYRRFEFTDDGISPRSRLGIDNGIFWNTGDESDETGHILEDPVLRVKMMDKRMSRLDLILDGIPKDEQVVSYGVDDFTIISWGSTIGPVKDAINMLKKDGISIGLIQLKLMHPFPTAYVKSLLKNVKTIIDVEANHSGQLGKIFKQNIQRDIDYFILKYTGRAMTSTEVYHSLKKIVENKADKREVLMHGA